MKYIITALVALTTFSALANTKDCTNDSNFAMVEKSELKKMIDTKTAFVVDVNTPESFAKNKIPTAINYSENKSNFAKVLPTDKSSLIVAYCGGPQCTAWKSAAQEACKLGYTNVKHYKDGIKGWMDSKG